MQPLQDLAKDRHLELKLDRFHPSSLSESAYCDRAFELSKQPHLKFVLTPPILLDYSCYADNKYQHTHATPDASSRSMLPSGIKAV
jgi:hypothetical protein